MNFNIGSKVKFLNDTGGGTVTKILDKKNVMVLTEYEFEIPIDVNELMLVEAVKEKTNDMPHIEPQVDEENTTEIEEKDEIISEYIDEIGNEVNIYLSFVKVEKEDEFAVYLINDSNYDMYFSYAEKQADGWSLIEKDRIEANIKYKLLPVNRDNINKKQEIHLQCILFSERFYELKDPVSKHIKLNPVEFFKENSFKENDFFEEQAIIIPVYQENKIKNAIDKLKKNEIQKIIDSKESPEKLVNKKVTKKEIEEVDLHLQEVIDDPTGLTKADMLKIQLETFRKKIDEAIKNKQKKIVFIHGLGNSKLKTDLRREIDTKYKNCKYQDASFQQYGFGATLVLIY